MEPMQFTKIKQYSSSYYLLIPFKLARRLPEKYLKGFPFKITVSNYPAKLMIELEPLH
jgi:hypothetical protein